MTRNQITEHAKVNIAGLELIFSSKKARSTAARMLWQVRGELIAGGCPHSLANRAAQQITRDYPRPMKPTARNYYRRAYAELLFSRTRWTSHDTEYYSACGWDDMQWEARQEARKAAPVFARAALLLAIARRKRS